MWLQSLLSIPSHPSFTLYRNLWPPKTSLWFKTSHFILKFTSDLSSLFFFFHYDSEQTLRLRYQWVYCSAFRSVSSELFIWLPGMKPVKPATLSRNRMCIPSVWPCSNGFVESINSHARTCSHKYTSLSPAHIETNLSFLLSHRQKHIFSLLWPYCSLFPALVLTYTHIEVFCIPILCP